MASLPVDPLSQCGIREFGVRLRRGAVSCESVSATYRQRIAALDTRLGAFTHVPPDQALSTARAIDALLATGTDLGPLMGVPVAVKDLFTVNGMPTTAGSLLDVADLVPAEGPFVQALKRAGCVILGKTRTTEFALLRGHFGFGNSL
jgi:aspartyl-tRNA(Asn)/glutamyl-tRNA(Gln) amidotransferase subunit A